MRPSITITAYVDEGVKRYTLATVTYESPNEYPQINHTSYPSLQELNKAVEECVAEAIENTYDYKISIISSGVRV